MARMYPYDVSADALFSPAKGLAATDYFQEWDRDDIAEPHLLCAEMSRLAYAKQEVVEKALPRVGFALKRWLGGERLKERFAAWGADGFVAAGGDGRVVVAFRGTESNKPEDLVVDLRTRTIAWTGDGQVHEGFVDALSKVQKELGTALPPVGSGSILITGHSLGAGLATLAAAALRERHPRLITFGSPRVGDADFARSIAADSVARFVNCCDLVTRVPPEKFDPGHIGPLLGDLTGERVLSLGLAQVIPLVLTVAGIEPTFADVGPPRYVSAAGTLAVGITGDGMKKDQKDARAQYRETHHLPTPHWDAILSALGDLAKAIRAGQSVREGLHSVGARLLPEGMGAAVPLRDLADHAPINYVSAMVRSFRPPR
jgi:hypothetical protein